MIDKQSLPPFVKTLLRPVARLASTVGFDPARFLSLRHYPRYRADAAKFRKAGGTIDERLPILFDFDEQAGSASGHYFHQDLLVASFIHAASPRRHIDVGSRIDGFVAHVAAFRQIEVIDVRDLADTGHPNIAFLKADLMTRDPARNGISDSISCLHAIEHFGLGRYGDPIDPEGHVKGFNNLLAMLKPGGTLYISFPVGGANTVRFNAERVFHPKEILSWANEPTTLKLQRFDLVDDSGVLRLQRSLDASFDSLRYGCGIYTFRKTT